MARPRGLSFFCLPDEDAFFLRLMASVRETVVYPILRAPSRKEIVSVSIEEYIPSLQQGNVIALAWPNTKVHVERSANGGRFTLQGTRSQILKYWIGRAPLDDSILGGNHIAYETCYVDKNHDFVHFDEEFLKWGDKVRSLIRKNTNEWENRRVTEKAFQAVKSKRYILDPLAL